MHIRLKYRLEVLSEMFSPHAQSLWGFMGMLVTTSLVQTKVSNRH